MLAYQDGNNEINIDVDMSDNQEDLIRQNP